MLNKRRKRLSAASLRHGVAKVRLRLQKSWGLDVRVFIEHLDRCLTHRLQTDFNVYSSIDLGIGYLELSGILTVIPVPPPIGSLCQE
jgi:hypothetical protein